MVHDINTCTRPNTHWWPHWPVPVFPQGPPLMSHTSHTLPLVAACARSCLMCKTISPKQTHINFNSYFLPFFSFISCPTTSERSDFASFVSSQGNLRCHKECQPCTYIQAKGHHEILVKLHVQINVVNPSSP